jgi:putative endonuclease
MKSYCVYILKCFDGSYYTGITSDLDNRIVQHQEGKWEPVIPLKEGQSS